MVRMDFADREDFFASPFPSDSRRDDQGRPEVSGFPNPQAVVLVDRVLEIVSGDARGFATTGGVFFAISRALDPVSLPTLAGSVDGSASVFLVDVTEGSPTRGVRMPIDVRFNEDPGLYGPPHQLSLLPLQGAPLRPSATYAAVVSTSVRDAEGVALAQSPAVAELLAGDTPAGMTEPAAQGYRDALAELAAQGVDGGVIAALSVFTTDDPTADLASIVERARADGIIGLTAFTKTDELDDFCVYQATLDFPVYQAGEPPYLDDGGGFARDASGQVLLDHYETARIVVTIPRQPQPAAGYPLVVLSRTGAGGDRPLVDRGVRAEPGGEAVEPGTGPALEFAKVGFAGVSVDGPHGGLRNVSGKDEQFLVFNFQNPVALRDNVRQSALELALLPDVLADLTIDVDDCPGTEAGVPAQLDLDHMALMGHSMGASIIPLTASFEPRYRALLLSGAGGSFLANMMWKQKPLDVRPLAELILGLTISGYSLSEHDPMLTMLQWAGEPADDPVYGRLITREPLVGSSRHVLMMQGIVDHYIMPPIANATSLSHGLDLAGDALDAESEELAEFTPLSELLPLVGRGTVGLPVSGNGPEGTTAVVLQLAEDGVEDGHEVVFQTAAPKRAYRCFLLGLLAGTPTVPAAGGPEDSCE